MQVRGHFRPEFLNRLDETVTFRPLSPAELREVARLLAHELNRRLTQLNIQLVMTGTLPLPDALGSS